MTTHMNTYRTHAHALVWAPGLTTIALPDVVADDVIGQAREIQATFHTKTDAFGIRQLLAYLSGRTGGAWGPGGIR